MKTARLLVDADAHVEMLPLIDVVFLVLAAFVYASTFLAPRTGLTVALPPSTQGEPHSGLATIVTIRKDGSMFLGERRIDPAGLERQLSAEHDRAKSEGLVVNGDRRARIGLLIEVMDAAREAGFDRLTVTTVPVEPKPGKHRPQ